MESRQFFGYSGATADSGYITTQYTHTPVPSRLFESLMFDFTNSPVSPFLNHFDYDAHAALSDSQERHSSTESLSVKTSNNSPFEASSYFQHVNSSPSTNSHQESLHTGYGTNIQSALQELEIALMDIDGEGEQASGASPSIGESQQPQISIQRSRFQSSSPSNGRGSNDEVQAEKRHKAIESPPMQLNVPPGNLKHLLIECARALSENRVDDFEKLVEQARGEVSISGEPIQRLGAYMIEGLVARKESSGPNIYKALRCKEPLGRDLLSYMHILYEICPYLKFGYMAANGAIAEACKNEDQIHIIDFQIAQGTQWMTLLEALARRPKGPPFVRITGIDDPISKYARGDTLAAVGKRLAALSKKFKIPVEFHAVPVFGPDVTREMLDVRPGEALAVNFPLQLHHTADESVDLNNPRDGLLRMVKSLNPKVTTLVEQESNTNTTPFLTRFIETLEYYSAMFDSIDVAMPRDQKERINVEQHCLAKDIVNIIACEGKERVERHELLGKWKSRLTMAGFQQYPLSSYVNSVIRSLLRCYSEHYTLVEKEGAMLLGWKERMLISASAWH